MRNQIIRAWVVALSVALMAGAAADELPDEGQLARFQIKVRHDMTGIPNYTCLETIERTRREPHSRAFKPIDTVHLEVSSVSGKELFAWPGARHFDDRELSSMVSGGAIGSGMFAMFAHNLFVNNQGARQYRGKESLEGRDSVRYDFYLTAQNSGLRITSGSASETVAATGSFWFDPASLDLIRLDVYGDGIPYSLKLAESVFRTSYTRTRIGDADDLLPKRSELTMTHFDGAASRSVIDFSDCHAYRTESTISFDAPATSLPEAPKAQIREVDLPAGLQIAVELDSAIDSKTAAVGDTLRARVADEVRYKGDLAVPRGAAVTAHLRKLDRGSAQSPYAVAIEVSEIEWEGVRAAFHAELADVDRKSAGAHKPVTYYDGHAYKVQIDGGMAGAGVFYIDAARFRIPPGFHMVWRTLAGPGRIEQ